MSMGRMIDVVSWHILGVKQDCRYTRFERNMTKKANASLPGKNKKNSTWTANEPHRGQSS